MSINKLDGLLKSIKFTSNKIAPKLKPTLNVCLKDIKNQWPKKLPSGIIHGDLFIDNIFFNKNKFSGFIDFYFSSNDYLMYEIAICINALCFDKKKNFFVMNNKKIKYFKLDLTNNSLIKKNLRKEYDYVINLMGYIDHSNSLHSSNYILNTHFFSLINIVNFFLQKKNIKSFKIQSNCFL